MPASRPVRSRITLALASTCVLLAVAACGSGALEAPPSPEVSATAPDGPLAQQLTGAVDDARAMEHLRALQEIADASGGNRASGTPGYGASVEYVSGVLRDAGFDVTTPAYEVPGEDDDAAPRTGRNVIAQTRTGDPGRIVMIGAHLDSVPEGPGIVDDGSGVASLLEIATRLGAEPSVQNAVRFAFFDDEESGAVGSTGYVESLPADDVEKIKLYLNVDMVASPNAGYFVQGGEGSDEETAGPLRPLLPPGLRPHRQRQPGRARPLPARAGGYGRLLRDVHRRPALSR